MKMTLAALALILPCGTVFGAAINCDDAQLRAMLSSSTYETALTEIRQNCRPGQSISWRAGNTALIGATCDMSKSVVNAGGRIVCVYKRN